MSNPKPARPAVQSTAATETPTVGAGIASIGQTEVTSNDEAPRSRTTVETNDAVEVAVQVEVESESVELNGTTITTFIGVQPGVAFADAPAATGQDTTAAAIAAFAEQD